MLSDYTITPSFKSIKGKKVTIVDSNKIGCVVIEHIFDEACLVRWPLLKNKTGQGIEFIKDLELKKEEKMGKIRLEEFDDEEFEDIEKFEKFSKTKKTKMKKRTKENKVKFDKPTNIIKLKKKNGKKEQKD